MPVVNLDIFFPVPEGWGFCTTCELMLAQADVGQAPEHRGLDEYPPDWQADFQHLSSLIFTLADRYQDKVRIRIWDPRSFQGLIKSIRHGIRRYPTFILDGRTKLSGWDEDKLELCIRSALKMGDSEI
jgi:hypothetical protein